MNSWKPRWGFDSPSRGRIGFRNANRSMPRYTEAVMSNADLSEIHAYLVSLPKPADPKSIPLLNN